MGGMRLETWGVRPVVTRRIIAQRSLLAQDEVEC
jgi:hypothetical protein